MLYEKLSERKKELGMTTEQLSQLSGVPVGTINKILSGETRSPRYATWQALERVLYGAGGSETGSAEESRNVPGGSWDTAYGNPPDVVREAVTPYLTKRQGEYTVEDYRKLPEDVVILTAGCAKYKYNKLDLGEIGGIPRVLDAGQCNDSYSLALIALKLKEVFGLEDVNDLPIVYNIAWYEQKAVIVLLALLHLGVKNIHLGPTLPAFLSPNVAKVLVDNFGIAGIGTVDEDLKLFFGEEA